MQHIWIVILLFLPCQSSSGKIASRLLITLENNSHVLADVENGNDIEGYGRRQDDEYDYYTDEEYEESSEERECKNHGDCGLYSFCNRRLGICACRKGVYGVFPHCCRRNCQRKQNGICDADTRECSCSNDKEASWTKGCLSCQQMSTNIQYNTNFIQRRGPGEDIHQVMSWNDCAARCLGKSKCQFWTWHNSGKYANICVLMSGYGSRYLDNNTISGTRGCQGCQLMTTNFLKRRDSESINQVMSWNDCAARCLGKSNCQFWTWHHGNSGKWANICVLMSGYGSRWEDSNTISGARGCLGTGSKYKNV